MQKLRFTPSGLGVNFLYKIEVYFNPSNPILKQTYNNAPDNIQIEYIVDTPGVYIIKAINPQDNTCFRTTNVELFFPVVTYNATDVDCNDDTYTMIITLVNPLTAGQNVQYGFSLINNKTSVSNWQSSSNVLLPADGNLRYVFVKNNLCTELIVQSSRNACVNCALTISNIQFICNS